MIPTLADTSGFGAPAFLGGDLTTLPWHVPATLLNASHAVCYSPPVSNLTNHTHVTAPVEITLNGQLADITGSNIPFEYYGPEVLGVRWIYPVAGPKKGGNTVTVYGTGFKSLGIDILTPIGPGGVSHASRGLKCIFGDLPMVEAIVRFPIGDERARAALGDDPDVSTDNAPLAAAIECVAPPWANISTYYLPADEANALDRCEANDERFPRAECEVDEPKSVCVRVTLNDDPHQHSGENGEECIRFTYYDE